MRTQRMQLVGTGSRHGHLHSEKPASLEIVAGLATKVVSSMMSVEIL